MIRSERLELVSMSPDAVDALLHGRREEAAGLLGAVIPDDWPNAHDAGFLRMRLRQMRDDPDAVQWLVRAIVLLEPRRPLIGHIGFHGEPGVNAAKNPDAVEVGYTVFESHRGKGYATEAVRALFRWAAEEHGIRHFVASVSPTNEPSLAIVKKLGFVQSGEQWDEEDGLELVFEFQPD